MKKFNSIVYIGRFNPPHIGHINTMKQALEQADQLIIVLGTSNSPRTIKNPFTQSERANMIRGALGSAYRDRIEFVYVEDKFSQDAEWVRAVQSDVAALTPNARKGDIAIIGHRKDSSSYYIDYFKNWTYIETECQDVGSVPMSATKVRELWFEGYLMLLKNALSPYVLQFLKDFTSTPAFVALKEEYVDGLIYEQKYENVPYGFVNFVTVDAVVVQSGHVLMVKRKFTPGKGLWALPGGHVNVNETLTDAVIRELREETAIKVPAKVLHGSIYHREVFDHPERSLRARVKNKRGRSITHAYGIKLDDSADLPRVKGTDDAAEAWWFTFDEIDNMRDQIFEDHASIISTMLARLK